MTLSQRLSICITLLMVLLPAFADITPDRMLLLRGAIALHEGRPHDAVADLREAADLRLEDWQCQMLYGQALSAAGLHAMAAGQLRRAVMLAPTEIQTWVALATGARAAGDTSLELIALSGQLRFFPEDPLLLRRLADVYAASEQKEAAARALAQWESSLPPLELEAGYLIGSRKATPHELRMILQENPNHLGALPALATDEWKAGNRDAAYKILSRVIKLRPNDPVIINSYAHACFVLGKPDEALKVLHAAAPLGNFELDRALANWSISQREFTEAIGPLQRMLMREPVNPYVNRQLGVAALYAGDYDTALAALRVSWMKQPDPVTAQHYVSALFAAAKVQEGEELLARAMALFPQETLLKAMLAQRMCLTDRLPQAAQLTLELSKARPETVPLLILAGERFLQAGLIPKAAEVAATLRDKYPDDVVAIRGAVRLYQRLANLSEARGILTRYLAPNVKAPMGWSEVMLEIANYALENNQLPEAESALTELFKHDTGYRPAYLAFGRLRQQQRQWGEAIRLYTQALTRWPNDRELLLAQARIARESGNYALSLQTYTRLRIREESAAGWLEPGDIYHIQGEEDSARACWRNAMQCPGGGVRARLALLISYEGAGEEDKAAAALDDLRQFLTDERARKTTAWREFLSAYALTPTVEETEALLLMAADLIDPAPLTHWRKPEPPPAEEAPVAEEKAGTEPAMEPAVAKPEKTGE
ncbi:MAG: tetratricopeptide repeat protein [bacterium ADurb.Bin429]|nr:MAG: tetratricopeptide repeat protein [bacterium ADurb.Bin429]